MSSDDAYGSFLDQANQDTGANQVSAEPESAIKSVDTDVPISLREVEQYYVSEVDEPFEPVSLQWSGDALPSEDEFKRLIDHVSKVTVMEPGDFDPRGQYKSIVDAAANAGNGTCRIYRVERGRARCEYYVVALDERSKKVVGLKAKAVET